MEHYKKVFVTRTTRKTTTTPAPIYHPCVTFSPLQQQKLSDDRVVPLITRWQRQRSVYYGISIDARTRPALKPVCLNFENLMPMLPLFVIILWQPHYLNVSMRFIDSIVLARHLAPYIPTMPQLTTNGMTPTRVMDFLNKGLNNVYASDLNDMVHTKSAFPNLLALINSFKDKRGDKMSICVTGYPEGVYNPTLKKHGVVEDHIEILRQKVIARPKEHRKAGCIITQASFRPEAIINYVKKVRDSGISSRVPIIVGIAVVDNIEDYQRRGKEGIKLHPYIDEELKEKIEKDLDVQRIQFRNFIIRVNMVVISSILNANIGVWGFQFLTENHFDTVRMTIAELDKHEIFSGKKYELQNSNSGLMKT